MNFVIIATNQILRAVSFLVIFVNVLEIILLLRARKRWCNAQILLFNLAITDAILGITTCIRVSFLLSQNDYSVLSNIAQIIFYGNIYGSSFIVVLISIDRWIAVKWPLKYRLIMSKKRLCIGILLSWILAVLTTSGVVGLERLKATYGWIYIGGTVLIAETLILAYLYCYIFHSYRKSVRILKSDRNSTKNPSNSFLQQGNGKIHSVPSGEANSKPFSSYGSHLNEYKYIRGNKQEVIAEKRLSRIPDKEKRLLRFCVAIVVCFLLSYMPAGIVLSFVLPLVGIKPWLESFIVVNAFCGSLWNPYLYFLHQFLERKRLLRNKTREEKSWKSKDPYSITDTGTQTTKF